MPAMIPAILGFYTDLPVRQVSDPAHWTTGVRFLYRPARKAGPRHRHHPREIWEFLYRPARKAGPSLVPSLYTSYCFYTDLPVRQVKAQRTRQADENGFYTDLPVRQVPSRRLPMSPSRFLYRPARKAGLPSSYFRNH